MRLGKLIAAAYVIWQLTRRYRMDAGYALSWDANGDGAIDSYEVGGVRVTKAEYDAEMSRRELGQAVTSNAATVA
jgi:hypothetical protein